MGSYKNLSIEDADNATTEIDAPTQAAAIESNPNATTNTIVTLPLDVIDTDFLNTRRRINQKEIDGLKYPLIRLV